MRLDIQGLRALAVTSVLLFHLFPSQIPGGYVGVDIFFVISGYLITGHLWREMDSNGSIAILPFWSRRIKRLLPAAFTVLVFSTIATIFFVPSWQQEFNFRSIFFASVYLLNWELAFQKVDYWLADQPPSIVQQYWSLSVEEQFYVILPLVMMLAVFVARKSRVQTKTVILTVLVLILFTSFSASVAETYISQPTAYFVTTTRAWEFVAGGLVAFAAKRQLPIAVHSIFSWFFLILLLYSASQFSEQTPFPGWVALIPVIATSMLLWLGDSDNLYSPQYFLKLRPSVFIGDNSYSIYLWHWPLIIIVSNFLGRAPGWKWSFLIVGTTIVLAWLTKKFIENPVRFSKSKFLSVKGSFAFMTTGILVFTAGYFVPLGISNQQAAASADLLNADINCLGAQQLLLEQCKSKSFGDDIYPAMKNLPKDDDNKAECWSGNWCAFGPISGYEKHIVAIGDSHNVTLLGIYEYMARTLNWRIEVSGLSRCDWRISPGDTVSEDCLKWRTEVSSKIQQFGDIDVVIDAHASQNPQSLKDINFVADGLNSAWSQLDKKVAVISVLDNPHPPDNLINCVSKYEFSASNAATKCAFRKDGAVHHEAELLAIARRDNSYAIDFTEVYCEFSLCSPVIGNVMVYRDESGHITATFARSLKTEFAKQVRQILMESSG